MEKKKIGQHSRTKLGFNEGQQVEYNKQSVMIDKIHDNYIYFSYDVFELNMNDLSDLFKIVGSENNNKYLNVIQDIKPTLYDELKTVFLTKDVESIKKILDYLPYFDKTKSIVDEVLKEIEKERETSVAEPIIESNKLNNLKVLVNYAYYAYNEYIKANKK
jgi:hypothetical protein